jgi:hypothetical protein
MALEEDVGAAMLGQPGGETSASAMQELLICAADVGAVTDSRFEIVGQRRSYESRRRVCW